LSQAHIAQLAQAISHYSWSQSREGCAVFPEFSQISGDDNVSSFQTIDIAIIADP
jgi:hypothetical protein